MNSKVKGEKLMLFDTNGKSLGMAKSHSLSLSAETVDTSSKDSGEFSETEVSRVSFEIQADHFYSSSTFDDLFDKMIAKTPVTVFFGLKSEAGAGTVDEAGTGTEGSKTWTKSTSGMYTGKVLITSLNLTANNGEYSEFQCTFTGVGSITRTSAE